MMTLEYNGQEKALADWGLAEEGVVLSFSHLEPDRFTCLVPGALVSDAAVFAFEGWIKVRQGRSWDAVNEVYTGGSLVFQGLRNAEVVEGRPLFEGVQYEFVGPLYFLQGAPYQQTVYTYTGDPDVPSAALVSEVLLFQQVTGPGTGIALHTGLQITDVLQHVLAQCAAASIGAPFQVGTIGVQVNLPTYPIRDPSCLEVVEYCLRSSPDAVLWLDYSTDPPTVNVTKRGDATGVTVALGDGVKHEAVSLVPRPDLLPRAVIVKFRRTNTVNGVTWFETVTQKYGPNGNNSGSDPDGGHRVVLQTIDLQGVQWDYTEATISTYAVDEDNRAWWSRYYPALETSKVRNFGFVGSASIVDEDGDAVSLASYPYVLEDGQSTEAWMVLPVGHPNAGDPVECVKATIRIECAYKQYDVLGSGGDPFTATNGRLIEEFLNKTLSARVTLTNAPSGTYRSTAAYVEEEAIPSGMAQSIYLALSALQYQGQVSLIEDEVTSVIQPGKNVLNLSGGRAEWGTMDAQIIGVSRDYGTGRSTVVIGPARFLSAGDLTQLFLINRQRYVYHNAASRTTGQNASRNYNVRLGQNLPRESVEGELANRKSMVFSTEEVGAGGTEVHCDAGNQRVLLRVLDAGGAPDASAGQINLGLTEADGRDIALRWLYYKDYQNGCVEKKVLVLCSLPEDV
jgi:hypothetical protein